MSIPSIEPKTVVAGDTVQWTRSEPNYLPEDGWTLAYVFTSAVEVFSVTATDNGDRTHLATISAATSAAFAPGEYRWQASVSKAAERHTVAWGATEVLADYASSPPADTRSTARRLLDAVEAALETRASSDQLSYSVGGVSISKMGLAEMMVARSKLRAEVAREKAAERIAQGLGHRGNIRVRL